VSTLNFDGPGPLPSALARLFFSPGRPVPIRNRSSEPTAGVQARRPRTLPFVTLRPSTHHAGVAALVVFAALTACSSASTTTPPTSTAILATSTTTRPDDGRLTIGVVAPRGGAAAELGTSTRDAVDLAINDINAHGGVNGQRVRSVVRDEGENPAAAALAIQDLVQLGVDAIIGPTSSLNTLGVLKTAVTAGVLTCSPTASALGLDDFPDNGLLVRTVPSDSLEALAMARLVEQSGTSQAVVVYLDDSYGRPFAQAVQRGLQADGTTVSMSMGFDGSEPSIQKTVSTIASRHPDVVVVVADNTSGPSIISAIDAAIPTGKPTYVVNDAQRRPATGSPSFGGGLATRVEGVSPLALPNNADFLKALHGLDPFAMNAYDCVNVIALAAVATKSNAARVIAPAIAAATTNGTACTKFSDCAGELSAGHNIDYNGPSGSLAIDSSGEVTTAVFERFGFNDTGRDISDGTVTIGVG
jgi:branched-chain amino acid transport system substrate-binding protein